MKSVINHRKLETWLTRDDEMVFFHLVSEKWSMPTCSFKKKKKEKRKKKKKERVTSDGILINKYHKKLKSSVLQITIDNY